MPRSDPTGLLVVYHDWFFGALFLVVGAGVLTQYPGLLSGTDYLLSFLALAAIMYGIYMILNRRSILFDAETRTIRIYSLGGQKIYAWDLVRQLSFSTHYTFKLKQKLLALNIELHAGEKVPICADLNFKKIRLLAEAVISLSDSKIKLREDSFETEEFDQSDPFFGGVIDWERIVLLLSLVFMLWLLWDVPVRRLVVP